MTKKIKNNILSAIILSTLMIPLAVGANISEPNDILDVFRNILSFLWQVFTIVTVIFFVIAGLMYATAAGEPTRIDKAKKMLLYGVMGAIVAILSGSVEGVMRGILSS